MDACMPNKSICYFPILYFSIFAKFTPEHQLPQMLQILLGAHSVFPWNLFVSENLLL